MSRSHSGANLKWTEGKIVIQLSNVLFTCHKPCLFLFSRFYIKSQSLCHSVLHKRLILFYMLQRRGAIHTMYLILCVASDVTSVSVRNKSMMTQWLELWPTFHKKHCYLENDTTIVRRMGLFDGTKASGASSGHVYSHLGLIMPDITTRSNPWSITQALRNVYVMFYKKWIEASHVYRKLILHNVAMSLFYFFLLVHFLSTKFALIGLNCFCIHSITHIWP